ncbi:MAG: hypothetical protein LBM00_10095 [Deltaproteobacteria bacterium]|jgi:hypothetical protein|nr:hypothetical protein [Deltaproteobacteria bacterium]
MNANFYINGLGYSSSWPASPKSLEGFRAFDIRAVLPSGEARRISKTGQAALAAACRATVDARLPAPFTDEFATRVGLYIGTAFGAIDSNFLFMDSICEYGAQLASPTHFSHSINNAYCGFISMRLNIQGPSCTVCQFGLSFAGALQAALSALGSRSIDLALVGAVEQAYDGLRAFRRFPPAAEEQSGLLEHACAAFFIISKEPDARYPEIFSPVWLHTPQNGRAAGAAHGKLSGERRFYTGHMAGQALDAAVACALLADGADEGTKTGRLNYITYAHGHKPRSMYAGIALQWL